MVGFPPPKCLAIQRKYPTMDYFQNIPLSSQLVFSMCFSSKKMAMLQSIVATFFFPIHSLLEHSFTLS